MSVKGGKVKELAGKLNSKGLRIAIVVSRFNEMVTERLLEGALDVLRRTGAEEGDLTVVHVPGSFEISLAAQQLAESKRFQAIVCLGALIRGETAHFDYLASEVTRDIAQVALTYHIPVSYGVITADTVAQAMDRAGLKQGNKGAEAALSAVEMANLVRELAAITKG